MGEKPTASELESRLEQAKDKDAALKVLAELNQLSHSERSRRAEEMRQLNVQHLQVQQTKSAFKPILAEGPHGKHLHAVEVDLFNPWYRSGQFTHITVNCDQEYYPGTKKIKSEYKKDDEGHPEYAEYDLDGHVKFSDIQYKSWDTHTEYYSGTDIRELKQINYHAADENKAKEIFKYSRQKKLIYERTDYKNGDFKEVAYDPDSPDEHLPNTKEKRDGVSYAAEYKYNQGQLVSVHKTDAVKTTDFLIDPNTKISSVNTSYNSGPIASELMQYYPEIKQNVDPNNPNQADAIAALNFKEITKRDGTKEHWQYATDETLQYVHRTYADKRTEEYWDNKDGQLILRTK